MCVLNQQDILFS